MFVELRVHGVSGTPPVDMLDRPLVEQVAGDTDGRFFRPVDSAGERILADGHVVEGYHWGPQTSGSWRQALWLALIPFGLVNAAYFMLPPGRGRAAHVVARAGLRVLGTVLTGLVVLALAQAAVDLFAWQWTGLRGGDPRWWLLAAFAAVVVALLVIRFLVGPPRRPPPGAPPVDDPPTALARDEFYAGDLDLTPLRHLHLAVGLTVLSVLAGGLARTYDGKDWLYWAAVVLLGLAIVHIALIGDPGRARPIMRRLSVLLLCLAVALLIAAVVAMMMVPAYPSGVRGILPGIADVGLWAAGLALGSLLVMIAAAAVLALRRQKPLPPKDFRPFLGGMVGPVVAALGMFLGVGFTAALSYGVLRVLRPGDRPDAMSLPVFHVRIAFAAGVAVALAFVLAAVLAGWFLVSRREFGQKVRDAAGGLLPAEEVSGVARAWWLARLKFAVQWPAIAVAAVGTVLTVAAVWEALADLDARTCEPSGTPLSGCADLPGPDLVSVGTTALVLLGGFLFYLGRRATGDSAVRRNAAVVWDVIAFWPAVVHPFVPPPYSPKVIEDLRHRIERHLDNGSSVVLAGHSQGSLIAVAALTRLAPENRDRVRLLTHGSQLQIAYARAFPAYVDYRFLCWLKTALHGRWISLYRETDPIGGPVQSWGRTDGPEFRSSHLGATTSEPDVHVPDTGLRKCGTEWRLLDPCPADGTTAPRLAMRRHSSYTLDPAWQEALEELNRR